jgi:predicted dehydrogenase
VHCPAAKAFLEAGIHVICDKPLTSRLEDAKALANAAKASGRLFVLTHNYTGYPMIRQAREMIASGMLGTLRIVQAEYPQDWLTEDVSSKQADWRTDPAKSGAGGALGDIELASFVDGRKLDDNAHVMLRFKSGAKGMLWASQVAPGHENSLKLRIYGTKGGLSWEQENPNYLWFTPFGEEKRLITRGGAGAGAAAARVTRTPGGHPEGYLEGFANIYAEAARAIRGMRDGGKIPDEVLFPTVEDGVEGVAFIEACVESSSRDGAWTKLSL